MAVYDDDDALTFAGWQKTVSDEKVEFPLTEYFCDEKLLRERLDGGSLCLA
jgi:hypothetical protein